MSFVDALGRDSLVIAAELRPPRAELGPAAGMDAWIDTYHADPRAGAPRPVRLSDRQRRRLAGRGQPPASRHQSRADVGRSRADRAVPHVEAHARVLPAYAERARQHGFPALVVLGGDKASARRAASSMRGSCARPSARAAGRSRSAAGPIRMRRPTRQVGFLLDDHAHADFYLTQIVSHHDRARCRAFLGEGGSARASGCPASSACSTTAAPTRRTLNDARASSCRCRWTHCRAEFASGADAVDICARTVRALVDEGARAHLHQQPAAPPHARDARHDPRTRRAPTR